MLGRRLLYLASWAGCLAFFVAYRGWMAWLFLTALTFLPWLSLLLSVFAMVTLRPTLRCPQRITREEALRPQMQLGCRVPIPPVRWKFRVDHGYWNQKRIYPSNKEIPAPHCGVFRVQVVRRWIYDYMGLLRIPMKKQPEQLVQIWPTPIVVPDLPGLRRYLHGAWRPKPGGGFAENYDLRLYRPGDDLRQIHWKLAAKTGKLVLREPIIPIRGKMVLTMILGDTMDVVDEKLGKLLYVSRFLLEKELAHEIHCLCDTGIQVFAVSTPQELDKAMEQILLLPVTQQKQMPAVKAAWQYRIGGDRDDQG